MDINWWAIIELDIEEKENLRYCYQSKKSTKVLIEESTNRILAIFLCKEVATGLKIYLEYKTVLMNSPKFSVSSVTSLQEKINGHKKIRSNYLVHCSNCYAAIIAIPPSSEYEIILMQPCPICNGLEQSFSCDYCFQKNTIYWDKKHFD
jgi:hypothetical protein